MSSTDSPLNGGRRVRDFASRARRAQSSKSDTAFRGFTLACTLFIALLMLPFVLLIGLNTLYTVWIGGISGNRVTAVVFNAFLIALVVAGTFQLV